MGDKPSIQTFEDFRGLDYRASDITVDRFYARQIQNYEFGEGKTLVARGGFDPSGTGMRTYKLHTVSYFDQNTGATVQELLAIGGMVFRLKTFDVTIDYSGGTYGGYRHRWDSGNSRPVVDVTEGGVVQFTQRCDRLGHPPSGATTYENAYDFCSQINALSNFTCSLPPQSAKVNGGVLVSEGSGVATQAITVDSGHTLTAGDWVAIPVVSVSGFNIGMRFFQVSATTATTVTIYITRREDFSILDNSVIGPGMTHIAQLGRGSISNDALWTTSGHTLTFTYWDPIPWDSFPNELYRTVKDYEEGHQPFAHVQNDFGSNAFRIPNATNADQSCFIFTHKKSRPLTKTISSVDYYPEIDHIGKPFKYDGQSVYRAGVPPFQNILKYTTSGGSLTGAYKWSLRCVRKDFRGVITKGNPIHIYPPNPLEDTLSSEAPTFTIAPPWCLVPQDQVLIVNGNQTGVTTITVDTTSGKNFSLGDKVSLYDRSANRIADTDYITAFTATSITVQGTRDVNDNDAIIIKPYHGFAFRGGQPSGTYTSVNTIPMNTTHPHTIYVGDTVRIFTGIIYEERLVTGTTPTSITVDGPAVSGTANDTITVGWWYELYRTVAYGNTFYLESDNVYPSYVQIQRDWSSSVADADLGRAMDVPQIGREHDLPPTMSIGAVHQGLLVGSGDAENPNTVYYSDPALENPFEYFPATNAFDVPSKVPGNIAGIASDSDDRLAVFKPNAYYDVPGDLFQGSFVAVPVTEGDYGISSQASLAKIKGFTIGLGPLGFVAVKNGQLVETLSQDINPFFWNNDQLDLELAGGVNDYTNRTYKCSVGYQQGTANETNYVFTLDYENGFVWKTQKFGSSVTDDNRPFTWSVYNGKLYYQSISNHRDVSSGQPGTCVFVEVDFPSLTSDAGARFFDWKSTIQYIYEFSPQHLDDPSRYKEYQWLELYALALPFDGWTIDGTFANLTFNMTVEFFDPFATITESEIITFLNGTGIQKVKAPSGKYRAMYARLTTDFISDAPRLTGFDWIVAPSYRKEDHK